LQPLSRQNAYVEKRIRKVLCDYLNDWKIITNTSTSELKEENFPTIISKLQTLQNPPNQNITLDNESLKHANELLQEYFGPGALVEFANRLVEDLRFTKKTYITLLALDQKQISEHKKIAEEDSVPWLIHLHNMFVNYAEGVSSGCIVDEEFQAAIQKYTRQQYSPINI